MMMRSLGILGLSVALILVASPPCQAELIRPNVPIAGFSQAELSARWWQWAISFPDGANPVQDTTGAFSHLGNQGPYFFLSGAFTQDPITRSVTIGPSQSLFFPLSNVLSVIPFFGNTEAEIRQDAADDLGVVNNLTLTLDGSPLALPPPTTSLLDFRQLSPPGLFDLVLSDNNVFGIPPVTLPAVSDGYWVALGTLTPGSHQLHFTSRSVGTGPYAGDVFAQDITYNITVTPEPTSWILLMAGLLGVGGYGLNRSRRRAGERSFSRQ